MIHFKELSTKHQIPNSKQIPIFYIKGTTGRGGDDFCLSGLSSLSGLCGKILLERRFCFFLLTAYDLQFTDTSFKS